MGSSLFSFALLVFVKHLRWQNLEIIHCFSLGGKSEPSCFMFALWEGRFRNRSPLSANGQETAATTFRIRDRSRSADDSDGHLSRALIFS